MHGFIIQNVSYFRLALIWLSKAVCYEGSIFLESKEREEGGSGGERGKRRRREHGEAIYHEEMNKKTWLSNLLCDNMKIQSYSHVHISPPHPPPLVSVPTVKKIAFDKRGHKA